MRLGLAAIIAAALAVSCTAQPGLSVTVGSTSVTLVRSSTSTTVGCRGEHGDAFPQQIPLTTVRSSLPVTVQFEAGSPATEIRGVVYDEDTPLPGGGPIEEFALLDRAGSYGLQAIQHGRTYRVSVNVRWSLVVSHGEESHLFRLRVDPP